jgi:hypothetical protein
MLEKSTSLLPSLLLSTLLGVVGRVKPIMDQKIMAAFPKL